jgi:glutamate racemase
VLGCTHYPFLRGAISYVMGDHVRLVSSDNETAKDVYRELVTRELDRVDPTPPTYVYEATGDNTAEFLRLSSLFLGPHVVSVDYTPTGAINLPLN